MKTNQAVEQLKALNLFGMARALEEQSNSVTVQSLSMEERLGLLAEAERHERATRNLAAALKTARFKYTAACPEDIDFRASRGLDRKLINTLLDCHFIPQCQNVIITGLAGCGRTWLSCAIGQQAARKGYSVRYTRFSRLLENLTIAYEDGEIRKLRARFLKTKLLIIDDWALAPLNASGRQELLEILEDRCENGATLIASQLPVEQWHAYIGERTMADFILERLVHRSHRIELRGDSMRRQQTLQLVMREA